MIKKSFFAVTIILACALSLCLSCNKQDSISTPITEAQLENPYNFVGEMHNAGLDAVLGALKQTKAIDTISNEEIERLTNDFCEEVFSNDKRFSVAPITKSGEDESSESEEVEISEEASAYLDKILDVASSDDYEYIKEQYTAFEEDLLLGQSNTFSDYENALLLGTLAIGKYSNEYWKEYTQVKTKGLGASIVVGDAIGAAKGIAKNALVIVVCSVGGPGSVIAAAARSALAPAIAGSAEAALLYGDAQL